MLLPSSGQTQLRPHKIRISSRCIVCTFSSRDFIDDVTFKITSFLQPKRLSRTNSRNSSTGSQNVPFQMERLSFSVGPEMESFFISPDQINKTGPILGSGQYGTAIVGIYSG